MQMENRVYVQKTSIGKKFLAFASVIVLFLIAEGWISFYMKKDFQRSLKESQRYTFSLEYTQQLYRELSDFHQEIKESYDVTENSAHFQALLVRLDVLFESLDRGKSEVVGEVAAKLGVFKEQVHRIEDQLKKLSSWKIAGDKMLSVGYQEELSIAKIQLEKSINDYRNLLKGTEKATIRKLSINKANADTVQLRWMILNVVIEVIAIALFIVVSIYLYRSVMIPIRDLKTNTMKLSRGDLNFSDVSVNIKRHDEIGALSFAFNVMARDIEKAVQEHQKLIIAETKAAEEKERSDELKRLNDELIEADLRIQETMHQLEDALGKEKELGRMKSRFVAIASHQFRTPLAIIQSNAELIKILSDKVESDISDRLATSLQRIESEIKRMTTLMNDVLIFGKVSAGQTDLNTEEVDVTQLCNTIINQFNGIQSDGRAMGVRVIGDSKSVWVDKKMLRHVVDNLVSNAFKYSSDDDPKCEISYLPHEVKVSISDSGIGIPDEEMDGLFEPFHRAENVGEISGTGLGLSIAKEYIELNGGTISVQSRENVGSTFTITLSI